MGDAVSPGGFSAKRLRELEEGTLVSASVVEGRLKLITKGGKAIDAGPLGAAGTPEDIAAALRDGPAADALYRAFGPKLSAESVTPVTGEPVTLGSVNRWTVPAPVAVTLPPSLNGQTHLIHIDHFENVTWPLNTEVVGAVPGQQEAWLSLLRDQTKWVVLVASHDGGDVPEGWSWDEGSLTRVGNPDMTDMVTLSGQGVTGRNSDGNQWAMMSNGIYGTEWGSLGEFGLSINGVAGAIFLDSTGLIIERQGFSLYAVFPNEGASEVTLASREWVEARDTLPKSVASPADLAPHAADTDVQVGSSTFVTSLGKPVWKSEPGVFVDALGTQVWPEE